tara:strand:+ start:7558 stop:9177 length:1620 start_codon:yes stop_codon:yes gene_type:complete
MLEEKEHLNKIKYKMMFTKAGFNYLSVLFITIYAFLINWISANIGVMPIDTFAFFDTGFSILKNKLPIRDFWIFTGIVVDYFQAFFFWIFGENWSSYVLHASFINIIGSLSFYFFLNNFKLDKKYSLVYTISFATLCYPVSGTPFAYIHAYIFSLISIFLMCTAIKNKNSLSWFVIPVISFFAFFSMQTPSVYIFLIIVLFSANFFLNQKDFKNFKMFIYGGACSVLFLIFFLFLSKTPIENLLYQYFLFPLTIGGERLGSDTEAYVTLSSQLNFNRIFGDFKFIHIFYIPLIILTINSFWKKEKNLLRFINLIIIFSVLAFLFNQLVTANQIYIFSLVPIIASILHLNIKEIKINRFFTYFIILVLCFVTIKFHLRYNIDRKFHDLENIDKTIAVDAGMISKKMKNLKWITPYSEPKKEIEIIKNAIDVIKSDERKKVLITHYQFFSLVLNEDLNLLNRWYLWSNDTHPTESHKYFNFYKKMIDKSVEKNNIEVIYLLGQENEILFKHVKNYFTEKCFESRTLIDTKFSSHKIIDCKN